MALCWAWKWCESAESALSTHAHLLNFSGENEMAKQNRFRRTRKIVGSVFFAALLTVVLHLTAHGDADPQPSAQTLTCEAMIEPLGISTLQPRLSWNLNSSMAGDKQIAYQI